MSRKKWIIENLTSLGLALVLVLMVRSSIIEAFKIPSGSMIPTLFVGDHIFVNKFAFGIKVPFSDWITDDAIYLMKRDPPKRGDIIVFKFPKDESLYYIKRVIGTPGDKIEIQGKRLFINDSPVPRKHALSERTKKILTSLKDSGFKHDKLDSREIEVNEETLGIETATILLEKDSQNYMIDSFGPITVPDDEYFVMGDNRDYSNDSRMWGFVPMRNVKGKAIVIWLSLWMDFKDWKFTFNPGRIGTVLH